MTKDFLKEEGQKYKDFALINYQYIEELQSTLRELIHIPSGAQVMHLENDDPENLFCLSFKTLPDSSSGAPHILEHTVLCGSRKFPVKDPFFAMNRRSLNTFMNALTGSDFTCYPAASQVEKDFYNLLEVFIDAVFHPQLKEMSFLQEGHRLEFATSDDPTSKLEYKGIVYNEMKGALSSADSRIWQAMTETLVPDLPYAHNSGGDPKEIPNLSHTQLIEFHEKYYHPSRCLFFFYGNFPLQKHLDFIAENALREAQKVSQLDGIGHQKRFEKPVKKELSYPSSETENLETKHLHAFGWLTTFLLNQEEVLALTILDSILMDTDASILKKALLDTKLCIQAESFLDTEMTEVPLCLLFRGCKKEDADALEDAFFNTLKKIAKEGIPFHLVEASMHQLEFSLTEIGGDHSPFGLTLFMRSALAKQHGCAPEHSLLTQSLFKEIREKAQDPHFFTPLIEKHFLHNPHFVRLSFAPDPHLASQESQEEEKRLQELKGSLNEKQIAQLLTQAEQLEEFQESQEGQQLECLPKVTLADVPAETRHFTLDSYTRRQLEIFHHDAFTNHIVYADLIFDLPNLDEDELFHLQLFISLWTELGVGKRDYAQNLEFIHAHTGGIGAHVSLHVQANDPMQSKPSLQLHGKALGHKVDKLFLLLNEFATQSRFDEKERIKELIKKLANALQNRLTRNAMRYACQLALSGFSVPSHINQNWYGLSFYQRVQDLVQHLDKRLPKLLEQFEALKDKLLCAGNPQLVLSCDATLFKEIDRQDFFGLPQLPSSPCPRWDFSPKLKSIPNQAHIISSPVAFTAQAFKSITYNHKDSPALQASTVLLENKVLHHRIREQGGAYGGGANYNSTLGNFYFYSYRDPHIAHSLHAFEAAIHEMAAGDFSEQDLEEAKLGIIQHFDTPTSPGHRAIVSYIWERDGKQRQIRQTYRDRLLSLTSQDIQSALKKHLLDQIDQGVIVTFAGKELLDKELPNLENKKFQIFSIT